MIDFQNPFIVCNNNTNECVENVNSYNFTINGLSNEKFIFYRKDDSLNFSDIIVQEIRS